MDRRLTDAEIDERIQRYHDVACGYQIENAKLRKALETAKTLWFNALFDQGTPRDLHITWYNEWLAGCP